MAIVDFAPYGEGIWIMVPTWEETHSNASGSLAGPLTGVRVLDLTAVLMGPAATQILGDLGADVIKVEPPSGDTMRGVGPMRNPLMGPLFLQANRNKRSVVIDLKSKAGMAALLTLAADADVFVTNVRPAAMERLGLGYDTLSGINPRIVYCAAVGYGEGGPDAGRPVYDDMMQASSGISGLFTTMNGLPKYVPVNMCDRIVGLYVVISIQAALAYRAVSGEGQAIEVPMFETMAQFVLGDHSGGRAFSPAIGDTCYKRLMSQTRGPYQTTDGFIAVAVYTDNHWRAFAKLVDAGDLLVEGSIFLNMASRTVHAVEIGAFIASHMQTASTATWLERLDAADIPACKVNSVDDLYTNAHLAAVGLFEDVLHPTEGRLTLTRFPVRFSKSPATLRRLPPTLGQHGKILDSSNLEAPAAAAQKKSRA